MQWLITFQEAVLRVHNPDDSHGDQERPGSRNKSTPRGYDVRPHSTLIDNIVKVSDTRSRRICEISFNFLLLFCCNLTILIILEYYVPLYSTFEQVLLPGDAALYKCFLLLLVTRGWLLLFYRYFVVCYSNCTECLTGACIFIE